VPKATAILSAALAAAFCLQLSSVPAKAATEPPYILVDSDSGQILTSRQAHQLWHPASLTKLMTAYLIFQAVRNGELKPDSVVKISARALAEPPSKMGFPVGTTMTVENALMMMLVHSSNDIAVALAETLGGSVEGFVARMNAQAARLGMLSTHYDNPNGLPDDGQITTARDLAVLARALWRDFPERRPLFSIPAIKTGKRVLRSYNPLLDRYAGTNGLKTGFICSSGYNLAASATRDGKTMIAIVLGATSSNERAEIAAKLLDRGFNGINLFKQDLATTREASPLPEPVNMRDEVCTKKRAPADEGEAEATTSALGPKFKLGDPVVVTTLSVPPAAASKSKVATKPRPKAPVAKASAASAAEKSKKPAASSEKTATSKDASKPAGKPATAKEPAKPAAKDAVKPSASLDAPKDAVAAAPMPKFSAAFAPN
jgi:D-alanyl-D-alanine carboxypeptidase